MTGAEAGAGSDMLARARTVSLAAAVGLMILTVALLAAAPLGYRAGLLSLEAATGGMTLAAFYAAITTGIVSIIAIGLSVLRHPKRGAIVGVVVLTVSLLAGFRLYQTDVTSRSLPPIHDVQTDWTRPVALSAAALRERARVDAAPVRDDAVVLAGDGARGAALSSWAGQSFAELQAQAYPFVAPLVINADVAAATLAADEVARRQGWAVMLVDPTTGQIEAVARDGWYGLAADIAVRIEPEGGGSRVDIRSVSRIARPDLGANATRIKGFLDDLAFSMRGREPAD
ncbi:DUF1499 domain-containing protein [bacterium]|nr:DUF1499 domain-containing protein [bacterium]